MNVELQRIYKTSDSKNEFRVLVDRLWPRGISKEQANLNYWAKSIAPSNELRKWIHEDLNRWPDFEQKYISELKALSLEHFEFLNEVGENQTLVLLYGSKNESQNHAIILKGFLFENGLVS